MHARVVVAEDINPPAADPEGVTPLELELSALLVGFHLDLDILGFSIEVPRCFVKTPSLTTTPPVHSLETT